ncbi:hypothetical protein RBU49_03815 [Clostridium sp. MB40-C1]|uniref:hypothetical protein n=1 Tax=Clostridium sp. MB40-C1 TaxID=3070996 RepID=UPI0027E15FB1|nr:hypothetical protein [Clostridium sp. MB40-C1]WMJ81395.1 hypothetical protein RBU49_03815 [Clostridium sp. MB40-C1]
MNNLKAKNQLKIEGLRPNIKLKSIKLLNNVTSIFLIIFLMVMFAIVTFFGYTQKNNIKLKQQEIQHVKMNKMKSSNKKYTYNDIIQYISNEGSVEIKKINKENRKTNKMVNMELEYKGDIERFNKFLDSIHKKENFHSIEKIKIDLTEDNNIRSLLICKFSI